MTIQGLRAATPQKMSRKEALQQFSDEELESFLHYQRVPSMEHGSFGLMRNWNNNLPLFQKYMDLLQSSLLIDERWQQRFSLSLDYDPVQPYALMTIKMFEGDA